MYRRFKTIEELLAYVQEDKEWEGAEATTRNRYPVRFILFENFADFNKFIDNLPDTIYAYPITRLIEPEHEDLLPTYSTLSTTIQTFIRTQPNEDYVFYPFSEMARFYRAEEFMTLVKAIKGCEPPAPSQANHIRIYVPIVGMQGKMGTLMDDQQAHIWEYGAEEEAGGTYRLILTNGTTYGVTGLERKYSVVQRLKEWLNLWSKGEMVRSEIICTSPNIYLRARYAQPDNAFTYTICHSAYEFLTAGLGFDFGGIRPTGNDEQQWEELARRIDATDFKFQKFVSDHFHINQVRNSTDFFNAWSHCETDFDYWLLALYYRQEKGDRGYVCEVLARCQDLSTSELFSKMATHIFETQRTEDNIAERRLALQEAARQGVRITESAERQVAAKLSAMMCGSSEMRYAAQKLMTSLTESERRLMVEQVGRGGMDPRDVERIYPELYHYMQPLGLQLPQEQQWIGEYMDAYRKAKIANHADGIDPLLAQRNATPVAFHHWYNELKTVKTWLHDREDIDVFYWIDGLGVDWVPFIRHVIEQHSKERVYLNEVYVARAILPTTTAENKPQLESLATGGRKLEKIGNLDKYAHDHKTYPHYIVEELKMVEEAIHKVLAQYNGKKIAFVSDHGLTYMAQHGTGLGLGNITGEHEGRVAMSTAGKVVSDNKYYTLDDGQTVCALTKDSLTAKTPSGHGAHGGALPEEVLVPIIIVSGQKNASNYSAELLETKVDGTNPVVRLTIRGLSTIDKPSIEYNDASYELRRRTGDTFESERLNLVDTATRISLKIGQYVKQFDIEVRTGVEEDDPFAGM